MWQDDLEQIVKLIQEVSSNSQIGADGFELDTVRDLAEFDSIRIKEFEVRADEGRIHLSLGRRVAWIEVQNPDLATRGMVAEVERVARSCKRLRWVVEGGLTRSLLPLAFFAALFGSSFYIDSDNTSFLPATPGTWISMIVGVTIGLALATLVGPFPPGAVLYPRTRAEAPTWLYRNRDALATNAIVSAVFLVVGITVGYMLPK